MTIRDIETRRRRAAFRAAHRGTKEMDLLMGRFAEAHLAAMSEGMLVEFERLLEVPDTDLQRWILAGGEQPGGGLAPWIARLRAFHGLE